MTLSLSCYAIKWEESFGFSFISSENIIYRLHHDSCISISLYFAFQKNHVKAPEKEVFYSKLHLHIPSVSLVLGIFYFN